MAQQIEEIIIRKRIVTVSRIDNEKLRFAVACRSIGFILIFAFAFMLQITVEAQDNWKIFGNNALNVSSILVVCVYSVWALNSYIRMKWSIMKRWGWDGQKPVEMKVCTADGILN